MAQRTSLQNRLTLRFCEPALESSYLADHARRAQRSWLGVQLVCLTLWLGFGLWDRVVLPDSARALWRMRLVVAPPYLLLLALSFLPRTLFARLYLAGLYVAMMSMALAVIVLQWRIGAAFVPYAYVALILITLVPHTVGAPRFVVATSISVSIIVAYIVCLQRVDAPTPVEFNGVVWLTTATMLGMFASYWLETYSRRVFAQRQALGEANDRADSLLRNILPLPIAERLKRDASAIADYFDDVSVLFADIVGFTPLAARLSPGELIRLLNRVFSEFDALADALALEKIKTVGDAYMVAAGLPTPRDDHAEAIVEMARKMRNAVAAIGEETGLPLALRIGIHCGSVVAGVIGRKKFSYDLWGDTVNTASRMESHGVPGEIQVSAATFERLRERYAFDHRGTIDVKGKGPMDVYVLRG